MQAEENKAVVRRYFEEVWNQGRVAALDEIMAPDFGGCNGTLSGRDAAKLYISSYREVFPQTRLTILGMITESDDTVTVCWASKGTYKGWCQVAQEGCTEAATTGLSVYRLVDSKIVEAWSASGDAAKMEKLGISPNQATKETTGPLS